VTTNENNRVASPAMERRPSFETTGERVESVLLSMQGISKDFPGGRVLHDVDLSLGLGEVHALVGQNGAGKSTLMKILAGHYPDHGGLIMISGHPVKMRSPKSALEQGIAVIYQEFALAPDLTVAQNIGLGREPNAALPGILNQRELLDRSRAEASALGIDLPLGKRVGTLSVAEQQLTEIVKAVARDARVLVMDEPTARLSAKERDHLFGIIGNLSSKGVGIIYISHFLEEIFAVASRATVLRDGRCVASAPLRELDVGKLARLVVGEKFRELDVAKRANASRAVLEREPLLRARDLSVEGKVSATSFTLHRGEVIGLAGLQGSGRTELADALVGNAEHLCGGEVHVGEFRGLFLNPQQALNWGVLMLPASRKTQGILALRTVAENIAIGALRNGLSRWGFVKGADRNRLVAEMLRRFEVRPQDPKRIISSLSGGNQQKVLFARAAAAMASILILDQPTAGVDVGATVEIYDQIDALTDAGMGVIVISDDLNELLRLSDRIFLVREGAVIDERLAAQYTRASLLAAITSGMKPEDYHATDDTVARISEEGRRI
jgi:ABC-type sugar transport system ATPase subunit